MADLLRQLEQEHRQVEKLMDQLENQKDPAAREGLLDSLEAAIDEHMETEEQIVYPVLAELDAEQAEEAEAEHDGARELLSKLRTGGVEQPGFGALVAALKGAIGHHVHEEEGTVFPKLRKEAGPERFTEATMDAAGTEEIVAGRGQADFASMTKDELYEMAKELGIDRRSEMTKDQLLKAVQAASRGT
ncbi:MAG TPA: hemerythrin domain-containing protein [Acidimicrobiales bacterium]